MSIDLVAASLWLDFPPARKLVLVALCERANLDTGECWPGRAEIAMRASISERSVTAHIASLEKGRWLITDRKATGPGQPAKRRLSVDLILKEGEKRRVEYQARTRAKVARDSEQHGKPSAATRANLDRTGETPVSGNRHIEPSIVEPPDARARESGSIFALYEQVIGTITPNIATKLQEAESEHSEERIRYAFREADELNKRSWRYVEAVLKGNGRRAGSTGGAAKEDPTNLAAARAFAAGRGT